MGYKVQFDDGYAVEFETQPTPADIEEVRSTHKLTGDPTKPTVTTPELYPGANKVAGAVKGAANFLTGTTGKTVGSLVTQGIGGATQALGGMTGNAAMQQKGQRIIDEASTKKNITPLNIGMTALELLPGGGATKTEAKVGKAVQRSGVKSYIQALNPTTRAAKINAERIAPEAMRKGLVFADVENLANKASSKAYDVGKKLDTAWQALGPRLKAQVQPIVRKLQQAQNHYIAGGHAIDQNAVAAYDNVIETITQHGKDLDLPTMRKIRRVFDRAKDFTLTKPEAYVKEAQKVAANAMRNQIAKHAPEIGKLNAQFTFWQRLTDVADATGTRRLGQKGALKILGGVVGASAGAQGQTSVKDKLIHGGIASVLGASAVQFITGPAYKSVSGVLKYNLGRLIASGRFKDAATLVTRMRNTSKGKAE